jgi:hypothetical protein
MLKKRRRFKVFKVYPPDNMVKRPPIMSSIAAIQAYMYIKAGINTMMIAIMIPSTNIVPPLIFAVSITSPPLFLSHNSVPQ